MIQLIVLFMNIWITVNSRFICTILVFLQNSPRCCLPLHLAPFLYQWWSSGLPTLDSDGLWNTLVARSQCSGSGSGRRVCSHIWMLVGSCDVMGSCSERAPPFATAHGARGALTVVVYRGLWSWCIVVDPRHTPEQLLVGEAMAKWLPFTRRRLLACRVLGARWRLIWLPWFCCQFQRMIALEVFIY
jgi:hypothetical protein